MSIYAIGDLHLPGHAEKPMNVFGSHWDRHFEVISEHWRRMVAPEDVVLIPGDISWAMQLEEALDDLRAIAALPGQKLLLRGNHDYWWSSLTKLRAVLPEGMRVIQNDALKLNGASDIAFVIGGSDGVSAAVRQRADETLSFGPVTLPHNLARVVLLEQLYRAQKISRGEPYHK